MRNDSLEIELKKWGCLKKIFKGSTVKIKALKKYIVILIPILYSITDSWSDANYCFGIASGRGIFDVGNPNRVSVGKAPWYEKYLIGQRMMLTFLYIGMTHHDSTYFNVFRSFQRYFICLANDKICKQVWN